MQAEILKDEGQVNALVSVLTLPRLSKYLQKTGGNRKDALELYDWNSRLSQALYLPLQAWEIVLRNKINELFKYKYNDKWPWVNQAHRNFNHNDNRRLSECLNRLQRDGNSGTVTTDQVVADLSAGFWVSQFGKDYASHYSWKSNLKFRIFTNDHSITREDADDVSTDLLELRNRVAHHEPIFHLPLADLRCDLDWMLGGMCNATLAFVATSCSFESVWNDPPNCIASERSADAAAT